MLVARMFLVAMVLGLLVTPSSASVVVNAQEVGSTVVFTASGTLDLSSFQGSGASGTDPSLDPAFGILAVGASATSLWDFHGGGDTISSQPFGPGGSVVADLVSGDSLSVGYSPTSIGLYVTRGYVSGAPFSGSSTFLGATFASLGLTPGTYQISWMSDFVTLNIVSAVPLPASLPMLAAGVGGLVLLRRHVRRKLSRA